MQSEQKLEKEQEVLGSWGFASEELFVAVNDVEVEKVLQRGNQVAAFDARLEIILFEEMRPQLLVEIEVGIPTDGQKGAQMSNFFHLEELDDVPQHLALDGIHQQVQGLLLQSVFHQGDGFHYGPD